MPKERQTCTECSMRRQKCDRNLPCSRCVKRGDADKCTREWPQEGYDPKKHRIYPRPEKQAGPNTSPISISHPSPGSTTTVADGVDASGYPALRTPTSTAAGQGLEHNDPARRPSSNITTTGLQAGTGAPDANDGPENSTIDFLGWGRAPLSNYQIKSVELMKESKAQDMDWDWDYSNGFGGTGAAQISFLQLLLPNKKQVFQLVEYHLNCILWYHASFHGPTFHKELTEYYNSPNGLQIRDTDLRWSAVLFATMAASMTCANDQQTLSWGFNKVERAKLTRQWFKATLCCLNLADYMWRHHIFSVQAIEVLTMSAHVLGFSNTQSTLLGAALKISQGLGLQRMSPDDNIQYSPDMDDETREKIIRREMGRRMWAQLCVQDWFSIPFSEMYTIQRNQFSTPLPTYLNDETLRPVAPDQPTTVSFNRCMADLARTFSLCHDAITESNTLLTKYDEVIKYEGKIKEKSSQLPAVMDINKPLDPSWPIWVPWARRSLAVCYAHKVIMVHRHFLGRSFTEATFARTRESCIVAAKTILKEAKNAYEGDGPVLWIDQAFMVASGITLSLDLFHRKTTEPLFDEHRKYVEAAIVILKKFDNSMIAIRGIRLLSQLLAEQARLAASQSMELFQRKRARDSQNPGTSNPSLMLMDPSKRQKFDVPRFVESLGNDDSFTQSLRTAGGPRTPGIQNMFDTPFLLNGQMPTNGGPQMLPPYQSYNATTNPIGIGSSFTTPTMNSLSAQKAQPQSQQQTQPQPPQQQQQQQQQESADSNFNLTATSPLPRGGTDQFQYVNMDLGFEAFENLFPPQTGISNQFLFDDLLNFDL